MPKQFDHDLCTLENRLVEMSSMVEEMIANAKKGLSGWDVKPFKANLEIEDKVDAMQGEVDEETVRLIAVFTPVAKDLRHLLVITKINTELERVGDQVINIGFYSKQMFKEPAIKPIVDIPHMIEMGREMLKEAIESFKNEDKEQAVAVIEKDNKVDDLHDKVFRDLMVFVQNDPSTLRQAMELILTARSFERIADHAVNIAEDVYFMIEGYDIRHETIKGIDDESEDDRKNQAED